MILSIITICLNEATSIAYTLNSIANQSFQDFEWIVIDGGSNDGTLEVISNYSSRINILISEKDKGTFNAMNKGIPLAKGEYLLFLNGGDQLFSSKVLEDVFSSNQTAQILYGNLAYSKNNKIENIFIPESPISKKSLYHRTLPHPATFIKRDLFLKYGFYDESYKIAADYDFFLKVILKKNLKPQYLPFTISIFDTEGISTVNEQLRICEKRRAMRLYFNFFDRLRYDSEIHQKWRNAYNFIRYPRYLAGFLKSKISHSKLSVL